MYTLGVDIGGTFTDFTLVDEAAGEVTVDKEPTTPGNPARGALTGARRLLDEHDVAFGDLSTVVHGTTLVSNTLIEKTGARTGLLTTQGIVVGLSGHRGYRYDMFDWGIEYPEGLVPPGRRLSVDERLAADGSVLTSPDEGQIRAQVQTLVEDHDVEAIAVSLLHAYENDEHERAVAEVVREEAPDVHLSLSSDVAPVIRETERTSTTVINAYAAPVVAEYLEHLVAELEAEGFDGETYLMTSSGGVVDVATAKAEPVRLIESGPAAGVLAARIVGETHDTPDVFAFDMGGTTAKGSVIREGEVRKAHQADVAREHRFKEGSGYPVLTPLIDLTEIGAGGGSIARVNDVGLVEVGPESAGSDPGPVCYGRGGTHPTVTDASLLLGYLDAETFYGGRMALEVEDARAAFERELADPLDVSVEAAAWRVFEVVNENMATAFRRYAASRGIDARGLDMVALGGAGPSHAFRVARKIDIGGVICPFGAGVGSSLGLTEAPRTYEASETNQAVLTALDADSMRAEFRALYDEALEVLTRSNLGPDDVEATLSLDMRHVDQGHEIEVPLEADLDAVTPDLAANRFAETYRETFNREPLEFPVEVLTYRLELGEVATANDVAALAKPEASGGDRPDREVYFGPETGRVEASVHRWRALEPGTDVPGPAVVEAPSTTVVADPASTLSVTDNYDVHIQL